MVLLALIIHKTVATNKSSLMVEGLLGGGGILSLTCFV